MGRRWTPAEDRKLIFLWGEFHLDTVADRMGRSPNACQVRAKRIGLGANRGTWTLVQLAKESGYSRSRILNACARLGITLRRVARTDVRQGPPTERSKYAITWEQKESILEHLASHPDGTRYYASRKGEWGGTGRTAKPKSCRGCDTVEKPHYSRGLCSSCYYRVVTGRTLPSIPRYAAKSIDGPEQVGFLLEVFARALLGFEQLAARDPVFPFRPLRVRYVLLESEHNWRKVRIYATRGLRSWAGDYYVLCDKSSLDQRLAVLAPDVMPANEGGEYLTFQLRDGSWAARAVGPWGTRYTDPCPSERDALTAALGVAKSPQDFHPGAPPVGLRATVGDHG